MSKLQEKSISIYEAMCEIQNGRYVMPAFQRQYVWSMEQIEKLWDSILLDYPIATFLFWHIDEDNVTWDTYFCNFLQEATFDSRKQADSLNYELCSIDVRITDTAVLDGQQRLTSLFLSLFGAAGVRQKYTRKSSGSKIMAKLFVELNRNRLNIDEEEYNSKKYDIRFSDKIGSSSPTQFEIKRILEDRFRDGSAREQAMEEVVSKVPKDSQDYARDILHKLYQKVFVEKLIHYTEIYGMKQDDALEMFVRFNSGGRALRKSEITMSILEVYWPSAKTEFGKLLVGPYAGFGTDFIIRAAFMIYGDVVRSTINKKIAEELKNNWSDFKKAFHRLEKALERMEMEVDRFAGSWNVLLPMLYTIYYDPKQAEHLRELRAYLVRAVLFTYFQSGTTAKLQQMKSNINENDYQISLEMLEQMSDLRVTDGRLEDILNAEKGSRVAGEALYFLSLDWRNRNLRYEQDHLHPFDRFEGSKPPVVSMEDWRKWRSQRNRLANLQLLEGRDNGSKSSMRLIDYYNEMNDSQQADFRQSAMIPEGVSMEFERFGEFYEARKQLLTEKIRGLMM